MKLRSKAAWLGLRSLSASSYFFMAFGAFGLSIAASGGVSEARQNAADIFQPVLTVSSNLGDSAVQLANDISQWGGIRAENQKLRNEIRELQEWQQTAMMLRSENDSLRELLNVQQADGTKRFVTSQVIADASTSYAKSLIINTGTHEGVHKGQGVVSPEGLIGRILEEGSNTARVLLLEDINSRVPVVVEGSDERAILAGQNDQKPILEHLRPDNAIQDGQRVITSGLGGIFPYGIPVGVTVKSTDGKVAVRLFADPQRSHHVQVVDYGIPGIVEMKNYAFADEETDNAVQR